jgi:SAM-dependent methyltransferase
MWIADQAALGERWRRIEAVPVTGWDFARFGDGIVGDEPPWSYLHLARDALASAASVLDIGTGGGEVLLSLAETLPPDTYATEGWPPNLPIAMAALAPNGIPVVGYDAEGGDPLPFPSNRFDVVLDRHDAYDVSEVARVLRPGGVFLTQQVDGRDLAELAELFDRTVLPTTVTLAAFRAEAEAAGLRVDLAEEWAGELRIADVDSLVGYLAMTPWTVDGFSVDRDLQALLRIHRTGRPLVLTQRRFILRGHA